jgi:hypothetical protein
MRKALKKIQKCIKVFYLYRTRTRRYEYLEQSSSCTLDLYEVQPCRGNEADCPPPRGPNGTPAYDLPPTTGMGFGYGQQPQNTFQQDDPACQTSDWSAWSPCSKKCGSGFQRRTRLYLIPFVPNRSCDVRLYDKTDCYGTDTSCDNYGYYGDAVTGTEDNYEKSTNVVIQSLVEQQQNNVNTVQDYDDNTAPGATEICSADKDVINETVNHFKNHCTYLEVSHNSLALVMVTQRGGTLTLKQVLARLSVTLDAMATGITLPPSINVSQLVCHPTQTT